MTNAEAREKCKTDCIFLGEVLGYDVQEDVHRDLFNAMGAKDKTGIFWARGHFKSSCVVIKIVQLILLNPDVRVLLMQGTLKLTKGLVKEVRSHFDSTNIKSRLPTLFPEFCFSASSRKKGDAYGFTCPARVRKHLKEQTVIAASPRAVQTGQHYDWMFFDDLVHTENFRNVELLDKLESQFYHFLPLLDPGGKVVVTGTFYSFADIYARLIAKDKGRNEWTFSIRSAYRADGSLLFPQRLTKDKKRKIGFTLELLASLKNDDPEMFAPQYLLQIIAAKDQLFPEVLLHSAIKSSLDPDYPRGACVMFVDLAEGKNSAADNCGVAVGRADAWGRIWIDEVRGGQLSPYKLVNLIIEVYLKFRPVLLKIEDQPGATFFLEFLRNVAREKGLQLPAELVPVQRQKGAKNIRISALEGAFTQKRLFLCAGIVELAATTEQFTQYPRGRHDDFPDVIAMLYGELAKQVPFRPKLKQLPYFFDVPHSSERSKRPVSPMGSGFVC